MDADDETDGLKMDITVSLTKDRMNASNMPNLNLDNSPMKGSINERIQINPSYRKDSEPEKPKIEKETKLILSNEAVRNQTFQKQTKEENNPMQRL